MVCLTVRVGDQRVGASRAALKLGSRRWQVKRRCAHEPPRRAERAGGTVAQALSAHSGSLNTCPLVANTVHQAAKR